MHLIHFFFFLECFGWKSNAFSTVCCLFVWYFDIVHDLSWRRNYYSLLRSICWCLSIVLVSIQFEFKISGLVYNSSYSKGILFCFIQEFKLLIGDIYQCMTTFHCTLNFSKFKYLLRQYRLHFQIIRKAGGVLAMLQSMK